MKAALMVTVLLFATEVRAQENPWSNDAGIQQQLSEAQRAYADNPYTVTHDTHLAVMEYEAWWGPTGNHFEGTGKVPLLTSASMTAAGLIGYDSADPAVIQQHADWMVQMGMDAILLDETNGAACAYAADVNQFCVYPGVTSPQAYHDYLKTTPENNIKIFQYYADHHVPLKIIPFLDGQDENLLPVDADGVSNLQKILARYQLLLRLYPNVWVYYEGKPMITFFASAPMKQNMVDAVNQLIISSGLNQVFTVRYVTCYADSQPQLWQPSTVQVDNQGFHESRNKYWSFIDRLRPEYGLIPIYAASNGAVEAMTGAIGFPAATGAPASWDDPSAGHRQNYFTFQTFVDRAKVMKPTFFVIDQFNEYVQPDEGYTTENTNDIEPTNLWGMSAVEAVAASMADYKNAIGGRVVTTHTTSRLPASVSGAGFYREASTQRVYYSNGGGHYCYFPSPSSLFESGGTVQAIVDVQAMDSSLANDGDCHVPIRAGFFRVANGQRVYYADGNFNFCYVPSPTQFAAMGGTAESVRNLDSFLEFNKNGGDCR